MTNEHVNFTLTNEAHKVVLESLGTQGELVIEIARIDDNNFKIRLLHKNIPVFEMPTVSCLVGDKILLQSLRIGMDLNFGT